MEWARAGRLDEEALLDACLHDQRYDRQCEEDRTSWMLELDETARQSERLRSKLIESFERLESEDESCYLCEIASAFAKRGDTEFLGILRNVVATKPFPSTPWLGESDLIDAEGDAGFRFCLRMRGQALLRRIWEPDDEDFIFRAGLVLGEERATAIIDGTEDPDVRRFLNARQAWLREEGARPDASYTPATLAHLTLDDLCAKLVAGTASYLTLRRWGRETTEAARLAAFERACEESNPKIIEALLTTLLSSPLPRRFDERMLRLCLSDDRTLRWRAYHIAAEYSDPQVRDFALEQVDRGADSSVVSLFVRNFRSGDERLLTDKLVVPADADERHRLGIELTDVLEENSGARVDELALVAAFETPCSFCRKSALELLRDRGEVPGWIATEAASDCSEATRRLFADDDGNGR